jgi:heme/copper-type cytochrome/quinol oxidase subunit 2
MSSIQLPADFGYGISWLTDVLIGLIVVTIVLFTYVFLTTRSEHSTSIVQNSLKYKLVKYHAERYWGIFILGALAWLFFIGTKFEPVPSVPVNEKVHVIDITAGQWFWRLSDRGTQNNNPTSDNKVTAAVTAAATSTLNGDNQGLAPTRGSNSGKVTGTTAELSSVGAASGPVKIRVGETVKFVARSIDVNHGFGLLQSSKSMDTPILQMQVIPGFDNVFYYKFKEPGTYTIRCLEYCGWNHPFMMSQITVEAAS